MEQCTLLLYETLGKSKCEDMIETVVSYKYQFGWDTLIRIKQEPEDFAVFMSNVVKKCKQLSRRGNMLNPHNCD